MPDAPTNEETLADALDQAISALQKGKPLDRGALLNQFPQLADHLDILDQFAGRSAESQQTHQTTMPGRIGPYTIERELGAGGFGVVYQGLDAHLKRRVAVKVLHPGRLGQKEARDRFQREACAIARLRCAEIVQLYDYSRDGPPYYLATELVEGCDLKTWARKRSASPADIADLIARVAEAIDYAHAQGVYHRDLKPGNVLVDDQGSPHILDFGLARLYREFEEAPAAPTSDGRILGTLAYMAPEQAAGHSHQADARSDVYSLGVILFELLTGRLPVEGPVHSLPMRVVENLPPSLCRLNPQVPRELEAVCLKALAKHPDDRYRSAAALARDLRAFLRGEPIEAQPLTWIGRVQMLFSRRHRDVLLHDWSKLLLYCGIAILMGCALVNLWQAWIPLGRLGPAILITKIVQVLVMLVIVIRYRPLTDADTAVAERQIWALVLAYYGGFATLALCNFFLEHPIPLAPVLAVLSGMAFWALGATLWGWFYVCGAAFFALAFYIAVAASEYGMLLIGLCWFIILAIGSRHLRKR